MNFQEYKKMQLGFQIQQSAVPVYFKNLADKPKSILDVLENQYSDSDEISDDLNLYTSVAFIEKPSQQNCIICGSNPYGQTLYRCPVCTAPYCKASCCERHQTKCFRFK